MAESIKGMKALLKRLEKIDKELVNDVDKIVQANGSEMAQTARRLAPVDTGKLRQSIRKESTTNKEEGPSVSVTAGVKYAPFIEFGTGGLVQVPKELQEIAIRFKGRGVKRIDLRPQPFMWPALILQRRQLTADIDKYLKKKFNL